MIVDVVTYRQVTGDTWTDDATVTANLERAQSRVEDRTERLFDVVERTESCPVIDGLAYPRAYPIASVTVPDGAVVTPNGLTLSVAPQNWLDDPSLVPFVGTGIQQYATVTYTGGLATVPVELADLICELAQRYSTPANTAAVPAGVTSVGINGQTFSGPSLGGSSALPATLKRDIRRFDHLRKRLAG